MPADPVVSAADTRMWNDRSEAAFQAYLEWKDTLPAFLLMDKLLKAAGTRDLIMERSALLADRERDRQKIAQLTKAVREADEALSRVPAMAVPKLVESFKRQALKAQRMLRAALSGEEEG